MARANGLLQGGPKRRLATMSGTNLDARTYLRDGGDMSKLWPTVLDESVLTVTQYFLEKIVLRARYCHCCLYRRDRYYLLLFFCFARPRTVIQKTE